MTSNQSSIRDKIHNFVDGSLSESEIDQLWSELLGRPDDLDYLHTLATLKKMGNEGKFDHLYDSEPNVIQLHAAKEEEEATSATFYERFKPYLAAASVLIIGVAILFNVMTNNVQDTEGVSPISMIEYEIERSADTQTTLDRYLQEAVSLATSGELEAAYNQLEVASGLDLSIEQSVDLKMVTGAIQYNTGNYSEALTTFEEIQSAENIDHLNLEKGVWYLANTQLQLGMTEQAQENMRQVIKMDGAFSRVAKQKLERF